jgi:L-ascorbate metabolism protein UlaG (beta-lactamase superfamily)
VAEQYGAPDLAARIADTDVPAGAVALWWLGQASVAIKASRGDGATTVYVDPYLQLSESRLSPSPFPPEALTNADLVLLTHDHLDHVDPVALPGIARASPRARFVAPRPIAGRVAELVGGADRVVPAVADQPLRLGPAEVLPVPAAHEQLDLTDQGYPYLGYTLRLGSLAVHHTGDTIPYPGQIERVRAHDVDVLLVPINGRDFYRTSRGTIGNMDYREAGDFAVAIGAGVAIPIHYGMFRGNTVPPGHFVSYLADYHPAQSVHVFGRFGKFVYCR